MLLARAMAASTKPLYVRIDRRLFCGRLRLSRCRFTRFSARAIAASTAALRGSVVSAQRPLSCSPRFPVLC
ncbi:hypothetical protein KIF59_01065 [Enterobacter cloacae subsp. cloacae]|nr:hypothetical protein [Enterobacter cloacae subsp. cloacae]